MSRIAVMGSGSWGTAFSLVLSDAGNEVLLWGKNAEVVDAVKQLAREVQAGTLKPSKIDDAAIASRLYAPDAPDPDLLIRTSGEMRTSNFLLWEVAYSELWFTPVFWPDFDREHLFEAIRDFQKRTRRFGALEED